MVKFKDQHGAIYGNDWIAGVDYAVNEDQLQFNNDTDNEDEDFEDQGYDETVEDEELLHQEAIDEEELAQLYVKEC